MIPVTQFITPYGEQRQRTVQSPRYITEMADYCVDNDARFTSEILSTGELSLACEYDDDDIVIKVCLNDNKAKDAMYAVVKEAYAIIKDLTEEKP